ncbi:hypothetical protein NEIRO02_2061 [Nematocida sp. AWRm79]|nr:hypothetical protein NEIRO02_1564 [Nematocida sp. AWRm79]KAI5167555.1 hypothetical protein NEIRO02_2061 [Nematocida sp. AWRm79]
MAENTDAGKSTPQESTGKGSFSEQLSKMSKTMKVACIIGLIVLLALVIGLSVFILRTVVGTSKSTTLIGSTTMDKHTNVVDKGDAGQENSSSTDDKSKNSKKQPKSGKKGKKGKGASLVGGSASSSKLTGTEDSKKSTKKKGASKKKDSKAGLIPGNNGTSQLSNMLGVNDIRLIEAKESNLVESSAK